MKMYDANAALARSNLVDELPGNGEYPVAQLGLARNPAYNVSRPDGLVFGKKYLKMANVSGRRIFRPLNFDGRVNAIGINDPINFGAVRIAPKPELVALAIRVRAS